MPELPEVETVVRDLSAAGLPGRRIVNVHVAWQRTVGGDGAAFVRMAAGRIIESIGRRGKWIVMPVGGPTLLAHLRMSGRLYLRAPDESPTGYERTTLALDDGRLLDFYDPRKFGRLVVTERPESILEPLGPEPLDERTTHEVLAQRLRRSRRAVKTQLLDQTVIAGLGNIYVDEALFDAGINPTRPGTSLDDRETERLHASIRLVLERGIANLGTSLGTGKSNFVLPGARGAAGGSTGARNQESLQVFRRTGEPCPRCGTPIVRIIIGQRATHLCPLCQPG